MPLLQRCFKSAHIQAYKDYLTSMLMGAATYLAAFAVRLTVSGIENWISMSPINCLRPARPFNFRPVGTRLAPTLYDARQNSTLTQHSSAARNNDLMSNETR